MKPVLNHKQLDLLHALCRTHRATPAEQLDGRVVRALLARGFAVLERGHHVAVTDAGREYASAPAVPPRPRGSRANGRAAAVLRIIEQLEQAIPPEAEVRIGPIQAAADDVLAGLRLYARRLEKSAQKNAAAGKPTRGARAR
jgi:hypothetical protein